MKKINLIIFTFILTQILGACNLQLSPDAKNTVPADHTVLRRTALHKPNEQFPFSYDINTKDLNCAGGSCHHSDLKGGIAIVNNKPFIAPSCYECHGKLWEDIDSVYSK